MTTYKHELWQRGFYKRLRKTTFQTSFLGRLSIKMERTVLKSTQWEVLDALLCWAPTLDCWLKNWISSWLWFCCSTLRVLYDCWAVFWTAIAWLAFTEATKLLTIAIAECVTDGIYLFYIVKKQTTTTFFFKISHLCSIWRTWKRPFGVICCFKSVWHSIGDTL